MVVPDLLEHRPEYKYDTGTIVKHYFRDDGWEKGVEVPYHTLLVCIADDYSATGRYSVLRSELQKDMGCDMIANLREYRSFGMRNRLNGRAGGTGLY